MNDTNDTNNSSDTNISETGNNTSNITGQMILLNDNSFSLRRIFRSFMNLAGGNRIEYETVGGDPVNTTADNSMLYITRRYTQ